MLSWEQLASPTTRVCTPFDHCVRYCDLILYSGPTWTGKLAKRGPHGEYVGDFIGFEKYLGAHRPLASLMFANDTFGGHVDWFIHGDDDTTFDMQANTLMLTRINPVRRDSATFDWHP